MCLHGVRIHLSESLQTRQSYQQAFKLHDDDAPLTDGITVTSIGKKQRNDFWHLDTSTALS